jgi:hypothetical protein
MHLVQRQYIVKIPPHATRELSDSGWVAEWTGRGGVRKIAKLKAPDSVRGLYTNPCWYIHYHDGTRHKSVKAFTDRALSVIRMGELAKELELARAGLIPMTRVGRKHVSIEEDLEEYRRSFERREITAEYTELNLARIKRVFDLCRFATVLDIKPNSILDCLAKLRTLCVASISCSFSPTIRIPVLD